MIWVSVTVSVLVSLGICAIYVHLWRRRIRRDMETDAIVGKLRREVGEIVTEMNGTTERNVALIENRINALNELLEKAGKSAGVLKRESEKHDIASQVYTSLERSRPLASGLNLTVDDSSEGQRAHPEAESAGPTETATGDSATDSDAGDTGDGTGGAGRSGDPGNRIDPADLSGRDIVDFNSLSVRDKALVMYRNGDGIDHIASELNMSRGEVELIISLHDRKGR